MLFSKKRMVLFVGGYGSGKTEVAVNYALQWRPQVDNLAIVDLDIVNPYFRSRERHELMTAAHIQVVAPDRFAVLDVGGDPVGARVLGRYSQMLEPGAYDMLFVVNASRPFSQAVAPAVDLIRAIETASRLKVTGLVNNTNLMQYTDLSLLQRGEELALAIGHAIGHATGLPLIFNAVAHDLAAEAAVLRGPILPLQLYMKRPWE